MKLELASFDDFNLDANQIKIICANICRSITLKYMTFIMSHPLHSNLETIYPDNLFIDCRSEYKRELFIKDEICPEHIVDLTKAGILAWPWNKGRLQDFITSKTDFYYNSIRQEIVLIKPFDIYVVVNYGNHAITQAMFFGHGEMKCNEAIDYSPLLEELELHQKYFLTRNKVKIKKSLLLKHNPELETLFLLGKKLVHNHSNIDDSRFI